MDIAVEISFLIVLSFTIFTIIFALILALSLSLIPFPCRSRGSDSGIPYQSNRFISDNSRAAVGVLVRIWLNEICQVAMIELDACLSLRLSPTSFISGRAWLRSTIGAPAHLLRTSRRLCTAVCT